MADVPLFAFFRPSRLFENAPLFSEVSWALQYSEFVGSKDFFHSGNIAAGDLLCQCR